MPQDMTGLSVSTLLTDAFGLTGKLPLALDEVAVPVVNVGELGDEAIWGPLALSTLYLPAGGAANNSKFEIALPIVGTQQGAAARIERLWIYGSGASNVNILPSPGLAAPTDFGLTSWVDIRTRGLPQVQIAGKNDAIPTALTGVIRRAIPATTHSELPAGWIIGMNPDTGVQQGLYIEYATVNATVWCTAIWRERLPR